MESTENITSESECTGGKDARDRQPLHTLNRNWTLWAHLPHNTDWEEKSYKEIYTFSNLESVISLSRILPDKLIKNCMLFLMREGIKPMWEDKENRKGGCFSYKVSNKIVISSWKQLVYRLVGENLLNNINNIPKINGITISPKRNFCIVKLWFRDCEIQDPKCIAEIEGLSQKGCLFKRHNPEY